MDRLATTLTVDYERSPVPPGAAVSDYLATLGRAHDVFIDVVADAGSSVTGSPGELGRVVAEQARLTRQFLDAQRTIIRYWAEVDAEIADLLERARYGATDHGAHDDRQRDHAAGQRGDDPSAELRSLLDLWWRREHQAGKELIADAILTARHGSAPTVLPAAWPPPTLPSSTPDTPSEVEVPAQDTWLSVERSASEPPAGQSAVSILSALADVRPDALLDTIDALIAALPIERAAAALPPPQVPPFPPPTIVPLAAAPVETMAVVAEPVHEPSVSRADDDAAFARFWNASRDTRRSSRPQVEAVVSLLSMLVVLTVVLAWIG